MAIVMVAKMSKNENEPPIRYDFPDNGPNLDFFEEIGPDFVRI